MTISKQYLEIFDQIKIFLKKPLYILMLCQLAENLILVLTIEKQRDKSEFVTKSVGITLVITFI